MRLRTSSAFAVVVWLCVAVCFAAPKPVDFNRQIKPILSNYCFHCHGPDEAERKGGTDGLRLDTQAGALEDLGGYAAVAPGKPEESALVKRIKSTDPDELMPPPDTGKRLSPREIELLTAWVEQGGKYATHWSYAAPERPPLPPVKASDWPKRDLDWFILSRLERDGLAPAPEADRYALIRRVSLDLIGLPPTLAEADAFVADKDPQAYEKLVDRLLADPAFGEHWAQMWLDLARYADSAGYADDKPRTIWLYRDWVIQALNANKPFDQFTVEQLAGDLLPHPTDDQLIATAFHRNTLTNNEGGTNDEEFRNVAVVDRVNTTMAVWMGTTIACAQCHHHKYDPISQEEFFKFFAIFNNTADADRGDESPLFSQLTDEQQAQKKAWQSELDAVRGKIALRSPEIEAARERWEAGFPRDIAWRALAPSSAAAKTKTPLVVGASGEVRLTKNTTNDAFEIEGALEGGVLRAIRLEALADDSLPKHGPGYADGAFVVSRFSAAIVPPSGKTIEPRYVRIELSGEKKILSLAEVQAFSGGRNVAAQGKASQSSTDFAGEPSRAIDGVTDGDYHGAKSTTHTAESKDPWWEVDLGTRQPIDRLVIWNRTDGGTGERLANFTVIALDGERKELWRQTVKKLPAQPSIELKPEVGSEIQFSAAVADSALSGFEPESLLKAGNVRLTGWNPGGPGRNHALTLIVKNPVEIPAGARVSISIVQDNIKPGLVLGRFRLSTTTDERAEAYGRAPLPVVAALDKPASERSPELQAAIDKHFREVAPEFKTDQARRKQLEKQLAEQQAITVPVMRELADKDRRVTKIQHRGNFLELGAEVAPGAPGVFPPLAGEKADRLAVAHWLVDPKNPLTGRVIANRYWEQLFGIGIVATSEEFGSQGDLPFHPELLDWLATELVRLKWDTKAFLRMLVTSSTYRQSSRVDPELHRRDPDNRLLASGPRFRLSAEMVRDEALFASGLLSRKMYGPPVKPPQPTSGLSAAFGSGTDWQPSTGGDRYRRALYTTWRRSSPYPSMATFDAPNRDVCTVRRVRTNTPLQALVTLNDPVYIEAAQALARRVAAEGDISVEEKAAYAFRLCLTRPPHADELQRVVALYRQACDDYIAAPEQAKKMASDPLGPAPNWAETTELAAWTVVGNVLLNVDEMFMKR